MKNIKIYIASGWFTPDQVFSIEQIESLFIEKYQCFEPRKMNLGVEGECNWSEVFTKNIDEIKNCEYMIVNTTDKDMGTLFEAGLGFSLGKKIIYYNPFIDKVNLMLSHSGYSICTSLEELKKVAEDITIPNIYSGEIE